MVKVKPIETPIFTDKRGRKSWLIPMISDLEVGQARKLPKSVRGQKLKTTRSNVSIWGTRHERKFTVRRGDDGEYYVARIPLPKFNQSTWRNDSSI
jgi:hypothetical protein